MAEEVGFEPTEGCPSHAFQACRFGRSRTPPGLRSTRYPAGNLEPLALFPVSEVTVGSCAMDAREPGQTRNGAAFIGIVCVPQIAWPPPQSPGTGTVPAVQVHLVDGTYELFRQHFGSANRHRESDREAGPYDATIGVLTSTLQLIEDGATHIGVASDHVIESFRNELWAGYKTSEGMLPELLHQIPIMEDALTAMGVTTWAMVEWEADDALAAAAAVAERDERVEQVLIVTPDKDLGQCVVGKRVVQYDRRKREIIDEDGVREKFGVGPESIPDYLGLVGDAADGFPGLPGWGAKSASLVLGRYGHLENIPAQASLWDVDGLRGAAKLSATLRENMELAVLFRIVATVDRDVPVGTVDDWRWQGPTDRFPQVCEKLGVPALATRTTRLHVAMDTAYGG